MNQRIKQVRKEFELSQAEFGKRIGISDAAVSKLESGKNTPSEQTIKLICTNFQIQYEWLTTGQGPMRIYESLSTDELVERYMPNESEFAKGIMKSFAKLPDEEWTKLVEMIDKVRKEGHP